MLLLFLISVVSPSLLLVTVSKKVFKMQLNFKMLTFEFIIAGFIINVAEIIIFSAFRPDFWIYFFSLRYIFYYFILGIAISVILIGLLTSENVKKYICARLKNNSLDSVLIVLLLSIFVFYLLSIDGIEIKIAIHSVNIVYIIISIFANLLLAKIICYILKLSNVKFNKFELGVILCANILLFCGCFISVSTRNYAYYWDEVREYSSGFGVEDWFRINTYTGIRNLFTTIRRDMRGPLANVFLAVPFAFTDKTPDSWVLSIFFNIFPAFSFVYGIFLKSIQKNLEIKKNFIFFVGNFIMIFSVPLLYRAYIFGYPDILGVMFCLITMICLFNLNFEEFEFKKWLVVYAVTITLALLRDQYIVWIISFYICYFTVYFCHLLFNRKFISLKRSVFSVIYFAIGFIISLLICMYPYIMNYLRNLNSSTDNSFWRVGGYAYEISNQVKFLGLWLVAAMGIGIIVGIINKKSRKLAIFTIIHGISTLIIFHLQVTLVSFNHSLVMMPFYILCVSLTAYMIVNLKEKVISNLTYAIVASLSVLNIAFAMLGGTYFKPMFTEISLVMPNSQITQIREVANWITNNCGEDDYVYFIPHGFPYNPDIFRYINMPDRTVMKKMTYGSAVFGNHSFPTQLFDSKYVMTSNPFCEYSIAGKYNDLFMNYLNVNKKFQLVRQFDMGDGYTILIYERIKPVDIEEVNFYRAALDEENKQYPSLYDDVFEAFIANTQL